MFYGWNTEIIILAKKRSKLLSHFAFLLLFTNADATSGQANDLPPYFIYIYCTNANTLYIVLQRVLTPSVWCSTKNFIQPIISGHYLYVSYHPLNILVKFPIRYLLATIHTNNLFVNFHTKYLLVYLFIHLLSANFHTIYSLANFHINFFCVIFHTDY